MADSGELHSESSRNSSKNVAESENRKAHDNVTTTEPTGSGESQAEVFEESTLLRNNSFQSLNSAGSVRKFEKRKKTPMSERKQKLKDGLVSARNSLNELRQDAGELKNYGHIRLQRATMYLGELVQRIRSLDQAASNAESRITPLKEDRKKLFNEMVNSKGSVRVYCRVRPQFEGEGASCVAFPNDCSIQINQSVSGGGSFQPANAVKKEFEFDHVFGPHIGQARIFEEVQPLLQSVLDGYNVSVLAYGQTGSGKTHTMEGSSRDRGIIYRSFDEIFDLSNSNLALTYRFLFFVTVMEMYNDQISDLLSSAKDASPAQFELRKTAESGVVVVGLKEEKVENPVEFSRLLKTAYSNRANNTAMKERTKKSHFIITIHVRSLDLVSGAKKQSRINLVILSGSEKLARSDAAGNKLTESLFISKSLSALGDCLSALTSKKGAAPYANSNLTLYLSDSLGDDSKVVIFANCSPNLKDSQETILSLNFATRSKNVAMSLGNRDTIKKWRDMATEARSEFLEKERKCNELEQENLNLQEKLSMAEAQAAVVFVQLQKAWVVTGRMQRDILELSRERDEMRLAVQDESEKFLQIETLLRQKMAEFDALITDQKLSAAEAMQKQRESYEAKLSDMRSVHLDAMQKQAEESEEKQKKAMVPMEVRIRNLEKQLLEATAAAEKAAAMAATGQRGRRGSSAETDLLKEIESKNEELTHYRLELKKNHKLAENLHMENERLNRELGEQKEKAEKAGSVAAVPVPVSPAPALPAAAAPVPSYSVASPSRTPSRFLNSVSESSAGSRMALVEVPSPSAAAYHSRNSSKSTSDSLVLRNNFNTVATTNSSYGGAVLPISNKLIAAMDDFDAESDETVVEISARANQLLRQVANIAGLPKADQSNQKAAIMAEVRDSVLSFLGRLQGRILLDGTLVAKIRVYYVKDMAANSPDLVPVSIPEVESFLEKDTTGSTQAVSSTLLQMYPMKVHLKPTGKFSKLLSFGQKGKSDGIRSRTAPKPKAVSEVFLEAKAYGTQNKKLAVVLAFVDQEETKRRIRRWLAESFEHLPLSYGADSELSLVTKAILEGWIEGAGTCPPNTLRDALGDILGELTAQSYGIQLQNEADLGSGLANEEVEDLDTMNKLRIQMEAVENKMKTTYKIMQSDTALLEPDLIKQLPVVVAMEARKSSFLVLESILTISEDFRQSEASSTAAVKKKQSLLSNLLNDKRPDMHPSDLKIAEDSVSQTLRAMEVELQRMSESPGSSRLSQGQAQRFLGTRHASTGSERANSNQREMFPQSGADVPAYLRGELIEWSSLQFKSKGGSSTVVVKCGATSRQDLVVKVVSQGTDAESSDIRLMPVPGQLTGIPLTRMVAVLSNIPEDLKALSIGKTASTTRERYTRLYKTLAARIPAMVKAMGEELVDFLPADRGGRGEENSRSGESRRGERVSATPTQYQVSSTLNRTLTDALPLRRS